MYHPISSRLPIPQLTLLNTLDKEMKKNLHSNMLFLYFIHCKSGVAELYGRIPPGFFYI